MTKAAQRDTYTMSGKERDLRAAFLRQVALIPEGEKIRRCIQCGTCTSSCPVSYTMDLTPRMLIAHFRAGDIETILRSNTVWICASCYACTVRCPSGIKITDIMYAFKRTAMASGIHPARFNVSALASSFMRIVNAHGRNQEVRLLVRYGLRTNPLVLLRSLPLGLRLHAKGRAPITATRIRGRRQLAHLMEAVRRSGPTPPVPTSA